MKNLQRAIFIVIIATALIMCANLALAYDPTPPFSCSGSLEADAYRRNYTRYYNQINSYFRALGNTNIERCKNYDRFADQVIRLVQLLTPPSDSTDYTLCRYAGIFQGCIDAVVDLEEFCQGICTIQGRIIGAITAAFYCFFSCPGPPIPFPPTILRIDSTCAFDFTLACMSRFDNMAQSFPCTIGQTCYDKYSTNPWYSNFKDIVCEIY